MTVTRADDADGLGFVNPSSGVCRPASVQAPPRLCILHSPLVVSMLFVGLVQVHVFCLLMLPVFLLLRYTDLLYLTAFLTWLKCVSNSAIDRNTTIILYLSSFNGTTMNETWASTMSPMRKICGFTASTLCRGLSATSAVSLCKFQSYLFPVSVLCT